MFGGCIGGIYYYDNFTRIGKENKLIQTHEIAQRLIKEENYSDLYNNLYSQELKDVISLEELIVRQGSYSRKPKLISHKITHITVDGNNGLVRSRDEYCLLSSCEDHEYTVIEMKSRYTYINNKWVISRDQRQCDRETPINNNEEFSRALSLIIQRYSESQRAEDREFSVLFKSIENCIDIKYASKQEDIGDADGVFYFTASAPTDYLTILVSPKYKSQDDLVTATLLVHELYHALLHSNGSDLFMTCLENETNAFITGYNFFFMLNAEEKKSLLRRIDSDENNLVNQYFLLNTTILNSPGGNMSEQFSNYVKLNPSYIKQCANEI